jgi:hypothetical protein
LASLYVGHAAQKSKLHNLQYDEGGNHMAETEVENRKNIDKSPIDYAILIFVRHAQRIVKPKFKSVSK